MAYDSKLKVDLDVFKDSVSIDMGVNYFLTPIYHLMVDNEAMLYAVNCNNDNLKKYLPSVFADNSENAKKILLGFLGSTAYKRSLLLCIRQKPQKFPIGYINLNFPNAATGQDNWSVNFWLGPLMQNKGIMSVALSHALLYLQKYEVPEVEAVVDINNIDAIKVLQRVGFLPLEKGVIGGKITCCVSLRKPS